MLVRRKKRSWSGRQTGFNVFRVEDFVLSGLPGADDVPTVVQLDSSGLIGDGIARNGLGVFGVSGWDDYDRVYWEGEC